MKHPKVTPTKRPTEPRPSCADCAEWLARKLAREHDLDHEQAFRQALPHTLLVRSKGDWVCRVCDLLELDEAGQQIPVALTNRKTRRALERKPARKPKHQLKKEQQAAPATAVATFLANAGEAIREAEQQAEAAPPAYERRIA